MNTTPESPVCLRRQIYSLLIAVAVGLATGRVVSALRVYEPNMYRPEGVNFDEDPRPVWPPRRPNPMPTFSSNDRSRWATVRALVDHGTFVVGKRTTDPATGRYRDEGILFEDGWGTVDVVLHPETHEFYSSKPPLLTVLAAGEYWLLKNLLGLSIKEQPFVVIRTIVLTFNVLPWFGYLWLLSRLVDRHGQTAWGRLFVLAAGAFGTLLTLFLISFNNHTVAACSCMAALAGGLRLWRRPDSPGWLYALTGLAAGFTACNELPATAFAVGLFLLALVRSPVRALLGFAPGAALPVAALLACNYAALGEIQPAYSHFGGPWYQYEGSHWAKKGNLRRGIDWAPDKEGRATYAFHLLLGHHGLFSLTPVLLLSAAGLVIGVRRAGRCATAVSAVPPGTAPPSTADTAVAQRGAGATAVSAVPPGTAPPSTADTAVAQGTAGAAPGEDSPRSPPLEEGEPLPWLFFPATLLLSLVVVGFYVAQNQTRNYGGFSNGPRWLMWLLPLWLLAMLPAADRLSRCRWGRGLALLLLGLSVLSASYQDWNPWRQPWLYNLLDSLGLIPY